MKGDLEVRKGGMSYLRWVGRSRELGFVREIWRLVQRHGSRKNSEFAPCIYADPLRLKKAGMRRPRGKPTKRAGGNQEKAGEKLGQGEGHGESTMNRGEEHKEFFRPKIRVTYGGY